VPDFAEARMNLGLVYQLQNRLSDAMEQFRRALKINPSLVGANFFLGIDYCNLGQGAKALPYLQAAVRQDPKRPETWLWLATAQEMSGHTQAEVATLTHALKLYPQNVDLLYILGRTYERMGKLEVANLEKIAPASSWSEQLLGESYATSSNWTFAVIRFQNALATPPTRPGLHVELGEVLLRARRLDAAAKEFDEELKLDPKSVRALVRRGEVKLIEGDSEGCLREWAEAISIDEPQAEQVLSLREIGFGDAASEQLPDVWRDKAEKFATGFQKESGPAAHFALAFLAMQAGNLSEAAAELASARPDSSPVRFDSCSEQALRENLDAERFSRVSSCFPASAAKLSGTLRVGAARALFEVGNYAESLKLLATLPPQDTHTPAAFYWRARCYEKLATVTYLHLYQADPESYRVHQLLGDLDAVRGDDAKAIDEYRAALAQKPSLPNLHYSLGHLLWKNLDTAKARAEFEAELAINPNHAGALHDLGNTYLLDHEPQKALSYLSRALAVDPADPELHRDLGTGYSELHDYRRAETEFKMAMPADNDGSIHYKLARAYQALGVKDKAAAEFALSSQMNRESHRKLEQRTERIKDIQELPQDSPVANE
jgi:tetratricopeptide (TPR) repeat protein